MLYSASYNSNYKPIYMPKVLDKKEIEMNDKSILTRKVIMPTQSRNSNASGCKKSKLNFIFNTIIISHLLNMMKRSLVVVMKMFANELHLIVVIYMSLVLSSSNNILKCIDNINTFFHFI